MNTTLHKLPRMVSWENHYIQTKWGHFHGPLLGIRVQVTHFECKAVWENSAMCNRIQNISLDIWNYFALRNKLFTIFLQTSKSFASSSNAFSVQMSRNKTIIVSTSNSVNSCQVICNFLLSFMFDMISEIEIFNSFQSINRKPSTFNHFNMQNNTLSSDQMLMLHRNIIKHGQVS